MESAPPPPRKRLSSRLFAACAGLVVLFVVAELGAQAWLKWLATDTQFLRFASISELQSSHRFPSLTIRHSYLGYALQPGYEKGANRINSLGYRGEEFPRVKPTGEFRIVCMGASTTFGGGLVDHTLTYPAKLQSELHARGFANVRVVNAGVSGYTSWESLGNYLFRVSDIDPDLVIVYHAVNDILARLTWPPETYLADNSAYRSPASQVAWPGLHEHSDILRILAILAGITVPHGQLDRLFGGRASWHAGDRVLEDADVQRMLEANPPIYFERNLLRLCRAAHDDGVAVRFLTFAHCSSFEDEPESSGAAFQAAFEEMNASLRSVAFQCGASVQEFAAEYPDDRRLFIDSVHMNAEGCALQARLVADALVRDGLLQP